MIDRAAYLADGYQVVRQLVDADSRARLRAEAFRFAARRDGLAVDTQLIHRSALLREFVTRGPQVALAVELLGPNVCFTHQQYIIKHPDLRLRTDIPWHQDSGYGRLEPPLDLTVWIALDDCTTDNGCLWRCRVRNGTACKSIAKSAVCAAFRSTSRASHCRCRRVTLRYSAVCCCIARCLNRTDTARVALYLRYCDPRVVMVTHGHRPVLEDAHSWMVAGEAD